MILIEARKLTKEYVVGNFKNQVIKGIDLEVNEKEFISIVGPSGSGKTTLLYLLSGLEKYTTGEILLFNKEVNLYNDKEMSLLRQKNIGFVFQFFNLIPNLNVFENVEISAVIAGIKDKSRIEEVLKMVGMEDSVHLYPNQISGGMQQRVG